MGDINIVDRDISDLTLEDFQEMYKSSGHCPCCSLNGQKGGCPVCGRHTIITREKVTGKYENPWNYSEATENKYYKNGHTFEDFRKFITDLSTLYETYEVKGSSIYDRIVLSSPTGTSKTRWLVHVLNMINNSKKTIVNVLDYTPEMDEFKAVGLRLNLYKLETTLPKLLYILDNRSDKGLTTFVITDYNLAKLYAMAKLEYMEDLGNIIEFIPFKEVKENDE